MEHPATDTVPLPVVETVAVPASSTTVGMPVDAPVPPQPPQHRDRTPLVLGLLALAAVVALGLSVVALARNGSPTAPRGPVGTDVPLVTVPTEGVSPPAAPAPPISPPVTASPGTTIPAAPAGTSAPEGARGPGKGKGGGKGRP